MTSVLYDVPGPKARRVSLIGSVVGTLVILGLLAWIGSDLATRFQFVVMALLILGIGDHLVEASRLIRP